MKRQQVMMHDRRTILWMQLTLLTALLAVPWGANAAPATTNAPAASSTLPAAPAVPAWEQAQTQREQVIAQVQGTVAAIYGEDRAAGGGSGVVIDPHGWAVTNFHVVSGAQYHGWVLLADGKLRRWATVGVDPGGDVALIRILGDEVFPAARWGDSQAVRVGDAVLTMGNPFTLSEDGTPSVSLGVISGVERYQEGQAAPAPGGNNVALLEYGSCLQVDASINPGNSGGPLFDMHGRLIGLNGRASFAERGRVNVGLGYAIPSRQVLRFLPGLLHGTAVSHGDIGLVCNDVGGQVICTDVAAQGPAGQAGLRPGDRVLAWDGHDVHSANQWLGLLTTYPHGATGLLRWEHQGVAQQATVTLAAWEYDKQALAALGWPPPVDALTPGPYSPAAATAGGEWITPAALQIAGDDAAVAAPDTPPAWQAALRKVVKIYGGGAGMEAGYQSGLVVSDQGDIVTATGVAVLGDAIQVVTADGAVHPARVVERWPAAQAVHLHIGAATPEYFDLQMAARDGVGGWGAVLSNAFNVAQGDEPASVTIGVVSWRGKLALRKRRLDWNYDRELLVLDTATANPGAPGGAVVDAQGRLIGMVGPVLENRQTGSQLNFAIPRDVLAQAWSDPTSASSPFNQTPRRLADSPSGLDAPGPPGAGDGTGGVDAPVLHETTPAAGFVSGIRWYTLGGASAPAFVDGVAPDSWAQHVGLQRDDLVLAIGGTRLDTWRQARDLLAQWPPPTPPTMTVKRGEQVLTLGQAAPATPAPGAASDAGVASGKTPRRLADSPAGMDTTALSGLDAAASADLDAPPWARSAWLEQVHRGLVTLETWGDSAAVSTGGDAPAPTAVMTGVSADADGYVLTSLLNLRQRPAVIVATWPDGTQAAARVVGVDHTRQVALLHVEGGVPAGTQVLPRVDPRDGRVGQWVVGVGLGYGGAQPALAVGVISARERILGRALQTDAALGPAQEGGVLVDAAGHVLGLIVSLSPPMGAAGATTQPGAGPDDEAQEPPEANSAAWYDSGVGFAVPLAGAEAKRWLMRLRAGENLEPGYLGVVVAPQPKGVVIRQVMPAMPASAAEKESLLQVGDIITTVAGRPVRDREDLRLAVGRGAAGDTISVVVQRHEQPVTLAITLQPRRAWAATGP